MKQLPKYELYAITDYFLGDPFPAIERELSSCGDWIKKEDLIDWLHLHLREGKHADVYSDLLEQLGEPQ